MYATCADAHCLLATSSLPLVVASPPEILTSDAPPPRISSTRGAMGPSTWGDMSDSLMARGRRFMTWGWHNAVLLATSLDVVAAMSWISRIIPTA